MSHNEILILVITQIVLPLFVYITLIFLVIIGSVYFILKGLNKGYKGFGRWFEKHRIQIRV